MALTATKYNHKKIDTKWQKFWREHKTFTAKDSAKQPKFYILDMFPYPSGDGLHVGHPRGYVGSDVLSHYYRLNGYQVLHPMGFDAFGLPAENTAIKKSIHPADSIKKNIKRFKEQLDIIGLSYDWSRMINTSSPDYYKWTQWLFELLYKNKLAYQKEAYVNWCPTDKTVLANEQVVNGCCTRCGSEVMQKKRKQWFLKITDFAEELLQGLDKLDWPESTKELQRNWIGKKQGIDITYPVDKTNEKIVCFTTRPDTNFGATFVVLAPEHPFIKKVMDEEIVPQGSSCAKAVREYYKQSLLKTELERLEEGKKKTGAFTGFFAINNLNGKHLPIWVSDFVLAGFGTGAVVGVPGHDIRDFEFAKEFDLPVVRVVVGSDGDISPIERAEQVQEKDGKMINSKFLDGLHIHEATQKIMEWLEKNQQGKIITRYRLRDWLVSRQRYWGAPIPVLYKADGEAVLVDEIDLPVLLPKDVEFKPTGESPLKDSKKFNQIPVKYKKRGVERREYDTLDTFVCSSWYFMRYADSKNDKQFASSKELNHWLPVDIYLGGAEHATGHLLYARFIVKMLHKLGLVNFNEPFLKLRHQGLILGENGEKMSKSKGNVVNPDEVVEHYGADALRMYEMFIGPFDQPTPWSMAGIEGVRRFLNRLWSLPVITKKVLATEKKLHQLIKQVTLDIEQMHFNTAVSEFMKFVNFASESGIDKSSMKILAVLLTPFAPHLAEELNAKLGSKKSVFTAKWPKYDSQLAKENIVKVAVQIEGKFRGTVEVSPDAEEVEVKKIAREQIKMVDEFLKENPNAKSHFVIGKIINFVKK